MSQQYHHGDLRAALLDTAERALNADPTRTISIRALAADLGVSPTAPHAHFKTKTDLLAALATRGFERLHKETLDYAQRSTTPTGRLEQLAEAYLNFSVQNAGLYKLMFTTGISLEEHPELFLASRRSYSVLQDTIQDIYSGISMDGRNKLALAAWSIVHGLSALRSENRVPDDIIDDRSPKALARIASATLLKTPPAFQ